ncbi:MAG: hypothetical protein M3417_01850 [Actinomycetota bacterium]|nr:hypothetical protein [Actinomycetota bacterium]
MLLADHAAVSEGKLFINGGGITRFNVPSLPFAIPTLSVVIRMLADEGDHGDHRLLLEFLNPDNVQTMPPEPAIVTVSPPPPEVVPGEEYYIQVVASFGGLPILRSGVHRFRMSWDEERIRELTLPVIDTSAEPSPLGRGAPAPRPASDEGAAGRRRND